MGIGTTLLLAFFIWLWLVRRDEKKLNKIDYHIPWDDEEDKEPKMRVVR